MLGAGETQILVVGGIGFQPVNMLAGAPFDSGARRVFVKYKPEPPEARVSIRPSFRLTRLRVGLVLSLPNSASEIQSQAGSLCHRYAIDQLFKSSSGTRSCRSICDANCTSASCPIRTRLMPPRQLRKKSASSIPESISALRVRQ